MNRPLLNVLLIVALLAMGLGSGCASGGGNNPPGAAPNLYQPFLEGLDQCQLVQHSWIDSQGKERTQIVDPEGSCTHIDIGKEPHLRARCVSMSSDGSLFIGGPWVEAKTTKDPTQLLELCPGGISSK